MHDSFAVNFGGFLGSMSSGIIAGLSSITPIGWGIIGVFTIITIVTVLYSSEKLAKTVRIHNHEEKTVYEMSKGGKQRIRDSGLADLTSDEIADLYKTPGISKEYKNRLKKEQKARLLRKRQKRENSKGKVKREMK